MRAAGTTLRGLAWTAAIALALGLSSWAPAAIAGTETMTGQLKSSDRTLDTGEYYDRHEVTVAAGDQSLIRAQSSQFDAYLIVQPPEDAESIQNDDFDTTTHDAVVEVDDAAGGTWTIYVTSSRPGESGAYTLRVTTTPPQRAQGGDEIQRFTGVLDSSDGRLDSGEFRDIYPIELRQGQRVVVELQSTAFDTYVGIISPAGRTFENDDWENSSRRSRVDVEADVAGTWQVVVTSFAPGERGAYELTIVLGGAAVEVAPTPGGAPIRGRLERGDERLDSGEFYDLYPLAGNAGETIVIDLHSREFDPYLILGHPTTEENWQNDDHASDLTRSQIALQLPVTGRYDLYVTSASAGEVGSYELVVQTREATSTPTAGPRTERGALAQGDETLTTGEFVDFYEVEGSPGQHAVFDLRGPSFDTYLMVIPPRGAQAENDDFGGDSHHSRVEMDFQEAGIYRVGVTSYKPGESGSYVLSMEVGGSASTPEPAERDLTPVRIGEVMRGSLTSSDRKISSGEFRDMYVFEANVGDTVVVDVRSSEFDTYVALLPPSGPQVDNDDYQGQKSHSRVELTLRVRGRYRVMVTSYAPGETGAYTVQVGVTSPSGPTARPEQPPSGTANVFGVFVGISDYPGDGNDLNYCAEDASTLRRTLAETYGMPARNAVILQNGEATLENIREAVRLVGPRVGANDLFVFFFSGHGDRINGQSQPADPDGIHEALVTVNGALVDDELNTLLRHVSSGTTLVAIDACFSGGLSKDVISSAGRMGLFSSEEDVESAVAAKFLAGGFLSKFLVEAIGADRDVADDDGDRNLTAIELCHYIQERYRHDVVAVKNRHGEIPASSTLRDLGYQVLVADRGGVHPFHVLFTW